MSPIGVSLTQLNPLHIPVVCYKLQNLAPGALPSGTGGGRGQGQAAGAGCLAKKDGVGGKVSLKTEQLTLAQVKPISTVKTCVSKFGVVVTCLLLGEQSHPA